MKTRLHLLTLLLLLAVTGCSSYRVVRNESDKAANWASYKTFAFVDTSGIEPVPNVSYQRAMRQVKQAVASELTKLGYQPVANADVSPDLLVNIGAVINEKTQTRETTIYEAPRYIGQRRYHWQSQEVPVNTYREGTFSVHIVDNGRNNLLWNAAIAGVLQKKGILDEQIDKAVAALFTKFPGKNS